MENNSYNVVTRVEQEDANAAAGEPLAVKAKAYSMPGVTVDGGDPVAVYEQVAAAVERARSGGGPTLVESLVYRLSAHGNIIAPPGVPLHFPEHEAIRSSARRRSTRPPSAATPCRASARRLVTDGTLSAEEADAIAAAARDEMAGGRRLRAREPVPGRRRRSPLRLRLGGLGEMARELPYIAAIGRGDQRGDGARRDGALLRPEHRHAPRTTRSCRRSAATACA